MDTRGIRRLRIYFYGARLDKAEQKGQQIGEIKKEIEAVIGLHNNGVSIAVIAKSLNISEDSVQQIIENRSNK